MNARRRRWRRVGLVAAALVVLLGAGCRRHFTRDQSDYVLERAGTVVADELQSVTHEGAARIERRRLRSSSGLAVDIGLQIPGGVDSRQARPLLILLGGHRTGRDAIDLVPPDCPAYVAALSFPYDGDHRAKGMKLVASVPAISRALRDTPAAVVLARRALGARPDLAISRVEVVGVSLGSPFVLAACAVDPEIARAWSIHGAGRLDLLLERSLERKVSWSLPRRILADTVHVLGWGVPYAPERSAARLAPRELVMINAADDERMPREAVLALFDAASEPKELIWTEGGHVRPKNEEVVAALIESVLGRLRAEGRFSAEEVADPAQGEERVER